jgi:hypothetical protein
MTKESGKDNQNTTQTPPPEYHTDDFIMELISKVVEQIHATGTPILSYESPDSPVWISDFVKSLKWQ